MQHEDIRQLAQLMKEMELTALEVSEGNSVIKLERAARQTVAAVTCADERPEPAAPAKASAKEAHTITAPMIGIFYAAPSPDMKPYVSIGDTVRVGDLLCIIEAMKMMNEITAEVSGVVTEVCVSNKQIVEYGHPLFRVDRAEPPVHV